MISKKALFIDRDGVICRMTKYPSGWDSPQNVDDVNLVKGIEKIILLAKNKGWLVVEISSQPGVAKGKQTQTLSNAIEAKVHELLAKKGADTDIAYTCPHHPRGVVQELAIECACRKPKPGLLLTAARNHNIDLAKSYFLGDKESDVQAAHLAGCKAILYLHEEDVPEKVAAAKNACADIKIEDLADTHIFKTVFLE